jgi:hypothetical protein
MMGAKPPQGSLSFERLVARAEQQTGLRGLADSALLGRLRHFIDSRVVHLKFKDITADPVGAAKRIYEHRGQACTAHFEERMRT